MLPRLHLITDDNVLRSADFLATAREIVAAHGPRVAVHLRGHDLPGAVLYESARQLIHATNDAEAGFVVNDRIDVALCVGAEAVQLGLRSLPIPAARALFGEPARIGYSAHGASEGARAEVDGADFLLIGTLFDTPSHVGREPGGLKLVRGIAERVELPVFGIGGITPERVAPVIDAGAYGIAVLSGVWHARDPVQAAGEYLGALGPARD